MVRKIAYFDFSKTSHSAIDQPAQQHLEFLEPRILLSADLAALSSGLSGYLDGAEGTFENHVFNQDLPLVGDNLATTGADFLEQLRSALTPALTGHTTVAQLQTALDNALNGLGLASKSLVVTPTGPTSNIADLTELKIGIDLTMVSNVTTDFELGLDGLPIATDGTDITGALTWVLNLDFGVDESGFFVDTSAREFDLSFNFDPTADFHLKGDLGFVDVGLSERAGAAPGTETHLTGSAILDLAATPELRNPSAAVAGTTPTVNLDGQINMTAVFGLGLTHNASANVYESSAPFPVFTSHFTVDGWQVGAAGAPVGAAPDVNFADVTLDVGGVGRFFSEAFGDVAEMLEPLDPIIDFFSSPTPLISQIPPLNAMLELLSGADGQGGNTPLDLIEVIDKLTGGNTNTEPVRDLLAAVDAILDLATLSASGSINIGSFDFGGADLRQALGGSPDFAALAQGLTGNITGSLPTAIQHALSDTGFGIAFPVLTDPTSLVRLLLGNTFDLVTIDLPDVDIDVPFDLPSIGPIWPLPPVYIVLDGGVSFALNLAAGLDTSGLNAFQSSSDVRDILDGLYVVDQPDLASFSAHVGAGVMAGVDFVLYEVGAKVIGGIEGTIDVSIDDPNSDGRLYLSEFTETSLDCLFEIAGKIDLFVNLEIVVPDTDSILEAIGDLIEDALDFLGDALRAIDPSGGDIVEFLENGIEGLTDSLLSAGRTVLDGLEDAGHLIDEDFDAVAFAKNVVKTIVFPPSGFIEAAVEDGAVIPLIPHITLFTFTHDDCDPNQPQPQLAELQADGTLVLNIGDRFDLRGIQEGEINEAYLITAIAPGVVRVDAFGISQVYGDKPGGPTVARVFGNGGSGNDSVKVQGRLERVGGSAITFDLSGGDGDDWLEGGFGVDLLVGNAGADSLFGGDGNDTLFTHQPGSQGAGGFDEFAYGGSQNDVIYGGAANDRLGGGDGDDLIFGGDGNDLMRGDAGIDTLFGLLGDDEVGGGAGNDNVYGGAGSDILLGNEGDDRIFGDLDAEIIDLSARALYGVGNTSGNAAWNDVALGDNVRTALLEPDFAGALSGDPLIDRLRVAEWHLGGATDTAGDGADHIETHDGNDVVLAGGGDDAIFTGSGDDRVFADSGNDLAYLGAGNDLGYGGGGNDTMFGEAGDDTMFGGGGADTLFGDFGEVARAGDGTVTRIRTTDADEAAGGADTVDGGDGADMIFGGVNGTAANARDRLSGGGDDDVMVGDEGQAIFDGDGDADLDSVETMSFGLGGGDDMSGGLGNDIAFGGRGDDQLLGDDPLSGLLAVSGGADILLGDNGLVLFFGSAVMRPSEIRTSDTSNGTGGADRIRGNRGNDVILGGINGDAAGARDQLSGDEDDDVILGDNGVVAFNDNSSPDLDRVETNDAALGGADDISGGSGRDFVLGGSGGDRILGDDPLSGLASGGGDDILVGDQGRVLIVSGAVASITSTDQSAGDGAADDIHGNAGSDVALGGVGGDRIFGDAGKDILLGDEGDVRFDLGGPGGDGDSATVDRIATTRFDLGAGDRIFGGSDSDIALGGTDGDQIDGDNAEDGSTPEAGDALSGGDILIGDQGEVALFAAGVAGRSAYAGSNVTDLRTTDAAAADGASDVIAGNGGDDIVLGGVGADTLMGAGETPAARAGSASDNDILIGDEGRLAFALAGSFGAEGVGDGNAATLDLIETGDPSLGSGDRIHGDDGHDVAFGGAGDDVIIGDLYRNGGGAPLSSPLPGSDTLFGDGGRIRLQGDQFALMRSINEAAGGNDLIEGNEAGDVIVGGFGGDRLWGESDRLDLMAAGAAGTDIILGDNGELSWILASDVIVGRPDVTSVGLDASLATLDRIMTTAPTQGGRDEIRGNGAADIILGGTASDTIWGDTSDVAAGPDGPDGGDLVFGDNGKLYPTLAVTAPQGSAFYNNFFFSIQTNAADGGAADVVFANGGNDIVIGGQGDDVLFGGTGHDDLIGGHNISGELGGAFGEAAHDDLDGLDAAALAALRAEVDAANAALGSASLGNRLQLLNPADIHELSEILDGGDGDDALVGDNGIVIRHGANFFTGAGASDAASPRFRGVGEEGLYTPITSDPGGLLQAAGAPAWAIGMSPNVTPEFRNNLDMSVVRGITVLDQSLAVATAAVQTPGGPRSFGNDIIVGGGDDDEAFGGLGDDLIQGDGRVLMLAGAQPVVAQGTVLPPLQAPSFNARVLSVTGLGTLTARIEIGESVSDGNDYIEGNGGNDRLYGNLGADDIIGGSSNLFGSLTNSQRIDGADLIFGGGGNVALLARNAEASASALIDGDARHGADADVIIGDNGNIYRIVDATGLPERFVHDDPALDGYSSDRPIAVRAVGLLDYGYAVTGSVPAETIAFSGRGAGDLVYGESGDDIIFGTTGDDVLYGNSDDDDIVGGHGADFILGGTGIDGLLGDDGIVKTARVPLPDAGTGTIEAEPLYGISIAATDINRVISSPGDHLTERINLQGSLVKSVELTAFRTDDLERTGTSFDDIIFGGLGGDFIHGGDGDDAISGAEALPYYYSAQGAAGGFAEVNAFITTQQNYGRVTDPAEQPQPFWYGFAPYNPGHVLDYQGNYDGTSSTQTKVSEFAYYDENAPRRAILLDVAGRPLTSAQAGARDFLLNFNPAEGPLDTRWVGADAGSAARATDGDDVVFGDLGNDWIVGGTGRDHAYGGYGDDLINMDDDHTSPTVQPNGNPGKAIAGNLENNAPDDYQSYSDITYGGAGRDVMIMNTGFDRAVDWTGEFNSFVVPFSPFGEPSITRALNPHVEAFLLDLSKADGADQGMPDGKLYIDQKQADGGTRVPEAQRHYEPFGELGMVRPTDRDWNAQHGGPMDPQAGNLPGQHRDVREREISDVPPATASETAPASASRVASASAGDSGSATTAASPTASQPAGAELPVNGLVIDWDGVYGAETAPMQSTSSRPSFATTFVLPTFIVVQSQLSGDDMAGFTR